MNAAALWRAGASSRGSACGVGGGRYFVYRPPLESLMPVRSDTCGPDLTGSQASWLGRRLRSREPDGGARRRRRCSRTPVVLLPSTAAGGGDSIGRLRHTRPEPSQPARKVYKLILCASPCPPCAMDSAAPEAAATTHRHRRSCHPKVAPASGESESPTSPPPPCSARRRVTRSAFTHTGVSHLHLPILPQQRRGRQQLSLVSSYV